MTTKSHLPTYDQLIEPTFRALKELGGSASINEAVATVAGYLKLSRQVIDTPHPKGSRPEFEYRLAWTRTYLKMAGCITNSDRGVWSLSEKGARIATVNAREIVREVRKSHDQNGEKAKSHQNGVGVITPQEQLPSVEEEPQDAADDTAVWRDALSEVLLGIPPAAFERLCQRLLRESGFIEVAVTGRSGDGGIDGRGIVRVAGLLSFNVLFQSKRHRGSIGAETVRDFRGAMIGRADKGLIITTGSFTRDARKEAMSDGAPPVDLIDGELLLDKLRDLKPGVTTKLVESVKVDPDWFKRL